MITGEDRGNRRYHAAAHSAHRLILEQHRELRRLLALGLVQTCAPSGGPQSALGALRLLVERIREVFVAHLSDEEAALLPLFGDHMPEGVRRTQILHEAHARLRRELEALHALPEVGSAEAFADRFDRLARELLVDISEEERELALAVAILDQCAAGGCDGVRRPIVAGQHHGSRAS